MNYKQTRLSLELEPEITFSKHRNENKYTWKKKSNFKSTSTLQTSKWYKLRLSKVIYMLCEYIKFMEIYYLLLLII